MTAVDSPPGLDFAGLADGEFRSRPRSRRLATLVFLYTSIGCGLAFSLAARHPFRPGAEFMLVLPLMCFSFAGLGFAIRRARLRIDRSGIRWGWGFAGFTMGPARIEEITVYRDAIAVQPKRGSLWYLARRDWDEFDRAATSIVRAEIKHRRRDQRAPIRARMQSYGLVLDGLMVVVALATTLLVLALTGV